MVIQHLRLLLRALLSRRSTPENPAARAGGVSVGDESGRIRDGLNYVPPVYMPLYLEEHLRENGKYETYLAEQARETYRFQFDMPQRGAGDLPVPVFVDDPLREMPWSTRRYLLSHTHAAYQRNPLAKRGCQYVADFVVGAGFNLSCQNAAVEQVLEAFIAHPDNDIRTYEGQCVIDLLLDGEIILRYFREDGELAAVPQRPWELLWISTEPGFFRRKVSYRFQRYLSRGDDPTGTQNTTWEEVPAEDIQFVAINRSSYELRGRPELFSILPWLRAYKEWLEDRARQNHWRGVFAWWVKIKTQVPGVIAAKVAQYRTPPTSGSVIVTSDNEEWSAVNNPVDANGAAEDGRQIKLMNAVGFGLPEYFLSDGANNNLASAKKMSAPTLTTFESFQRILVEQVWTPMFLRVLQAKIDAGVLPEQVEVQDVNSKPKLKPDGSIHMIDTLKAFAVSYAPLEDTDIVNVAQAMQMALDYELASKQSASTRLGFDYDDEKQRLANEAEEDRQQRASGDRPTPPGSVPEGYDALAAD